MWFFGQNYYKPGPGVDVDEPRKKGILRFFEICSRDFFELIKLNVFFFICCVPSAVLFVFFVLGLGGAASMLFFLLSLAAAFPVGGAISAAFFCVTKMLRDDPGFIWHDFKRKFKENLFVSMPAGIICALVFYTQVYILVMFAESRGASAEPWMAVLDIIALVVFGMVMPYVFAQAPYLYLKQAGLLKNSLILAFINAPRSFMGAVQGGAIWALYAFFFPVSILFSPLLAIIGFTLSWLLALMWVWKPVDGQFRIEETFLKRRQEALDVQPTE